MKAEWLQLLREAVADSGLVHLRLGNGKDRTTEWRGLAVAEMIVQGYLHPLPEQNGDPYEITYRVTDIGRAVVSG